MGDPIDLFNLLKYKLKSLQFIMALVNCPECNHLMSENASVCPNCNKPRTVEKLKNCINCGKEIGSRKKKCQNCDTIQINNSKTMSTSNSKNSSSNILMFFLIFILGGVIMYFAYPFIQEDQEINNVSVFSKEDAKVNKINGLCVYVESYPKDKENYTVLKTFEGDNVIEMVNSLGIGKENVGKVLENILNLVKDNINFHEQLSTITEKVKEQYPEAQGVIFSNKIKKCEVIVFNN